MRDKVREDSDKRQSVAGRVQLQIATGGADGGDPNSEANKGAGHAAATCKVGSLVERYYTQLFSCTTNGEEGQDMYVNMHSNRLCVVGVAPSHALLQVPGRTVVKVDFSRDGMYVSQPESYLLFS